MNRKRSLLLTVCYSGFATLTIFYGLIARQSLFVTFVSFHLIACLGIPLSHRLWEGDARRHWREAWGDGIWRRGEGLFLGLATGVCLFAAIVAGYRLLVLAGVSPEHIRAVLTRWGLTAGWIGWFAAYLTVLNSFFEELLWRGFVLERLLASLSRRKAMVASSLFFSLYHLIIGVVLFGWAWGGVITGLVFLVGLLFALLKITYRAIWAAWLSHLLADLAIVTVLIAWIY